MYRYVFFGILLLTSVKGVCWGFHAHKMINRMAIFTLPSEMSLFFKQNIHELEENAVLPDKRRYIVENEAARHYIDAEKYGDSSLYKLPRQWNVLIVNYSNDSLQRHGILPWHIQLVKYQLTQAMAERNAKKILRLTADMGHYVGDAHVPLHTTFNYNGQYTRQTGIHAFWESRLPELFSHRYDFFVGKAQYINHVSEYVWMAVISSHTALDSVLHFEKQLSADFNETEKYSFEERNTVLVRTYSYKFSKAYHDKLNGQVENRMRKSVKMLGDLIYTAWVDAGQPNLSILLPSQEIEPVDTIPNMKPTHIDPNRLLESRRECGTHYCCHELELLTKH